MSISNYTVPTNPYEDWRGSERRGFVPTARQKVILDAYAEAVATGLYYTKDIYVVVSKKLGLTPEQLAQCTTNVDGGDFGYDLYQARSCYNAMTQHKAVDDAAAALCNLQVGMKLGTLIFNDHKRTTDVSVLQSADPTQVALQGKRGAYKVTFTTDALSIKCAIERAASKGVRKDSFEDFAASLRKPLSASTVIQPRTESASADLFAAA